MQITAELDNQHIEKLKQLEINLGCDSSALIALAIDYFYSKQPPQTEGEKILTILKNTHFLASMPDNADLSENYKQYLDWSDKV